MLKRAPSQAEVIHNRQRAQANSSGWNTVLVGQWSTRGALLSYLKQQNEVGSIYILNSTDEGDLPKLLISNLKSRRLKK